MGSRRTEVLGTEVVTQRNELRPLAGGFSGNTQSKVNCQVLDGRTELTNGGLTGSGLLNVGQFGLEVILLPTNLFVPLPPSRSTQPVIFLCCQASHVRLRR